MLAASLPALRGPNLARFVASLNIEQASYERMNEYESFQGPCFVDTLDMAEEKQLGRRRTGLMEGTVSCASSQMTAL